MKYLLYLFLLAIIFSCGSSKSSSESTPEHTSMDVQVIAGLNFTSQITTELDYSNKPVDDVSYISPELAKVFVYNNFRNLRNGPHEYVCNVSKGERQGVYVGTPFEFKTENNEQQVWSWFETTWLDGPGDYTMDVYLDGILIIRKPFRILSETDLASGEYARYWLQKDYYASFTTNSTDKNDNWQVQYVNELENRADWIIPVIHNGFIRIFLIQKAKYNNAYELLELTRSGTKLIRTMDGATKDQMRMHARKMGNFVQFISASGAYDMAVNLETGEWEPVGTVENRPDQPSHYPSPDGKHTVILSCSSGVSLKSGGTTTFITELNCDVEFGMASWDKGSTTFYFDYLEGIYSYHLPSKKLTQILYEPYLSLPAYFNSQGMDFLVYQSDKKIYFATNATPNSYFDAEYDYENKFRGTYTAVESNEETLPVKFHPSPLERLTHYAAHEMEALNTGIYEIGIVSGGQYAGATVYRLHLDWVFDNKGNDEMYAGNRFTYFLAQNNKITFLNEHFYDEFNDISRERQTFAISDPGFAFNRSDLFKSAQKYELLKNARIDEVMITKQLITDNGTQLSLVGALSVYSADDFEKFAFKIGGRPAYKLKQDDGSINFLRPDGTRLVYQLLLDEVEVDHETISLEDYAPYTSRNCFGSRTDLANIQQENESDLTQIGSINGSPIFTYTNQNHQKLKSAYQAYKDMRESGEYYFDEESTMYSYNQFMEMQPIFIYKDGLGRYIRFINKNLLPPLNCEPIVYFYPENEQEITFTLDPKIDVLASYPAHQSGWKLMALPDGRMVDAKNGKRVHRIFWEGISGHLPRLSQGYVMPRQEVDKFLTNHLAKLGLNEMETGEFKDAWLHILREKPYCFIGFYDQSIIDKYAPVTISPKPNSIIRVLMDFELLDAHRDVLAPAEKPTPSRDGFTVVEWGGLKR